jgi:hypothetical protein
MISAHREISICSGDFGAKIKALLLSSCSAGAHRVSSPKNIAKAGFIGKASQLGDRIRAVRY